jgi:hypothetical protein
VIDNAEISKYSSGIIPGLTDEESNAVRLLCDKNKDGKISIDEMKACFDEIAATAVKAAAAGDAPASNGTQPPTLREKGVAALLKMKNYDYRGLFEKLTTSMRKHKIASLITLLVLLVPLHFAGALPQVGPIIDSLEATFSKVALRTPSRCVSSTINSALSSCCVHSLISALTLLLFCACNSRNLSPKVLNFNGADSRKDFITYVIFVVACIVVPAGYVFADTYGVAPHPFASFQRIISHSTADVAHTLSIELKDDDATKWSKLTKRVHAGEITLFCALLITACVRRIRSTGHSVLLLIPYFFSVVALDVTDLVPTLKAESFPQFLQPVAAPIVAGSALAHIILSYLIPASERTRHSAPRPDASV